MKKLAVIAILAMFVMSCAGVGKVRPETMEEGFYLAEAALYDANALHESLSNDLNFYLRAGVITKDKASGVVKMLKEAGERLDDAGRVMSLSLSTLDIAQAAKVEKELVPSIQNILREVTLQLLKYKRATEEGRHLLQPGQVLDTSKCRTGFYRERAKRAVHRTDMELASEEAELIEQTSTAKLIEELGSILSDNHRRWLKELDAGLLSPAEYDFLIGAEHAMEVR